MTTKAKPTKIAKPNETPDSRPAPKAKGVLPAPVSGPVPPALNDTRADSDAVLGHSVVVTKGEHEGFFGTFIEAAGDNAIVRSRADAGVRVVVPIADCTPADPNRR